MARSYHIEIIDRGEEFRYECGDIQLTLFRTYCSEHRLFCTETIGPPDGPRVTFEQRKMILEDLCDHFETRNHKTIFVIDEADRDVQALKSEVSRLKTEGHLVRVEIDSAAKRERARDEMYLGILKFGKLLSINGVDIKNEEAYWQWKGNA